MRVSLSWLKEYIHLDQDPAEIAEMMTMAGLEVDAIETVLPEVEGVVVGLVVSVEKHPNADKLVVAKVSDGIEEHQVVCGAPNCREGMKTAFAPVGAKVPEGEGKFFEIRQVKLRGVESSGMLCSSKELGIDDRNEGILEMGSDMEPGQDLSLLYPEIVFEVSLTPNLGHCNSVLGIVRELAAITKQSYVVPSGKPKEGDALVDSLAKVKVEAPKACPRYAARVIQGVKVAPSPVWLQKKLALAGIRSVNNVVDVTNFVLMELGHPLHAFDYDKLSGHEIVVKQGQEGAVFTTLDEKHRTLTNDTLMICDAVKGVAVAGVMGGLESEVSDATVNVLLESAYFSPTSIRKTSKRFALQTDASKRFERGTDPNNVIHALDRAADLIEMLAGGSVAKGVIDVASQSFAPKKIACRIPRVSEILGIHLSSSEIESIFQRLCFPYDVQDPDTLMVTVPTYRNDIHGEIDLIEEVARIYGYDHFRADPILFQGATLSHSPVFLFERNIRSRLIAQGLQEYLTCDLISPELVSLVEEQTSDADSVVTVLNPTSYDQSILRPSMLPGLLQIAKHNIDRQNFDISGFEVGRIHFREGSQYKEQSMAGILMTGCYRPHHWEHKSDQVDFYDIKGILENLFEELGIVDASFKPSSLKTFHPGRQATIEANGLVLGLVGEIHPSAIRKLDVEARILYAELNLHMLIQASKKTDLFTPLPQYPSSKRDWTITLKQEVPVAEVMDAISSIDSPILEKVVLLDLYQSDSLGKDKKNVTFHFVYRDRTKTVSQEEVDNEHARITQETLKLAGKAVI